MLFSFDPGRPPPLDLMLPLSPRDLMLPLSPRDLMLPPPMDFTLPPFLVISGGCSSSKLPVPCYIMAFIHCRQYLGIVPFVTTPLKGRFVVFSKQLLIGYFRLGDCPAVLGNWPCSVTAPHRGQKQEKSYSDNGVVTRGTIPIYFYPILKKVY